MDVKIQPFVNALIAQVGAPYIWTGKGDYIVTREGKVVWRVESMLPLVFDCSGLVNWARLVAGGNDHRGTFNAQRLMGECSPTLAHPMLGRLRFYGDDEKHIEHVSVVLAKEAGGVPLIIDASGGDSTTRTLADAHARKARVRIHFDTRKDFVAELWPEWLKP